MNIIIILLIYPIYILADNTNSELITIINKSKSNIEEQKIRIKSIKEHYEEIYKDGNNYLKVFEKNLKSLQPYLKHESTIIFLRIIQEYIDMKLQLRRDILNFINTSKIEFKRSNNEFNNSLKLFNRIKILSNGAHNGACSNSTSTEDTKDIKDGEDIKETPLGGAAGPSTVTDTVTNILKPYLKNIILINIRIKEINEKLIKILKEMKLKGKLIEESNRKLLNYRFMLEMIIKSNDIIVNNKNILMKSINIRDKVTYNYNRYKSLIDKSKLIIMESNKKELYNIDKNKLNQLYKRIFSNKKIISKLNTNVIKEINNIKSLIIKSEQYEMIIKDIGLKNIKSPNTGYKESQNYYQLIILLSNKIVEIGNKIKLLYQQSIDMLEENLLIFNEMENVINRKILLKKPVIDFNDVMIKRKFTSKNPQLEHTTIASSSESDGEGDGEVGSRSEGIVGRSEGISNKDSSTSIGDRRKRRKTRHELNETRGSRELGTKDSKGSTGSKDSKGTRELGSKRSSTTGSKDSSNGTEGIPITTTGTGTTGTVGASTVTEDTTPVRPLRRGKSTKQTTGEPIDTRQSTNPFINPPRDTEDSRDTRDTREHEGRFNSIINPNNPFNTVDSKEVDSSSSSSDSTTDSSSTSDSTSDSSTDDDMEDEITFVRPKSRKIIKPFERIDADLKLKSSDKKADKTKESEKKKADKEETGKKKESKKESSDKKKSTEKKPTEKKKESDSQEESKEESDVQIKKKKGIKSKLGKAFNYLTEVLKTPMRPIDYTPLHSDDDTTIGSDDDRLGSDTRLGSDDTSIQSDETRVETDDTRVQTDDTRVQTDDTRVQTDDTSLGSEDGRFELEKLEDNSHEILTERTGDSTHSGDTSVRAGGHTGHRAGSDRTPVRTGRTGGMDGTGASGGSIIDIERELNNRFKGLRLDGTKRNEAIKLIEMAYGFKNQFEIVTRDLDKSIAEGAVRLVKTILMETLHIYLTGICVKVLNITDISH
ncbi:uncharacterized protein TA20260 [Theileria annulata]|uniref:Uncharacterized protein n=1 Tax=Theileria annulata TaxID=5874 RepID=Q4UHA5_THEAN|nr:uncharacterized protein TA20260 [Theileria annulata]CAI73534.1 hypothetical protein TA20260 [Theileria annulata]|eukprot:XP_954211.1 hypothetical protein TA20260 [Theileria annulata]